MLLHLFQGLDTFLDLVQALMLVDTNLGLHQSPAGARLPVMDSTGKDPRCQVS